MRQIISPNLWRTTASRKPHSVPVVDLAQFSCEQTFAGLDDTTCDQLESVLRAIVADHPVLAAMPPR